MMPPSRPLRILLVPALTEASGSSLLAARLARRLDPARFACRMVLPAPGDFAEKLRAEGLRVDTLGLRTTCWSEARGAREKLRWLVSRFAYGRDLDRLMGRYRPDVVYVHSAIQPLSALVARRRGLPVLWHVHEIFESGHPGAAWRKACVRRLASTVIFCARAARRSFGPIPRGRRWVVVPNGISLENVPTRRCPIRGEIRRELNIRDDEFVMITVGRAQSAKGLDLLAEALGRCRALREGGTPFRLLVAGDTGGRDNVFLHRVVELFGRAGLRADGVLAASPLVEPARFSGQARGGGCVTFLGHREDVPRCLAAADVFLLPSRAEAFPLSLLEAFAAELAVVATDVGDCRLLVNEPRRGLCVPRENPDALAGAIERLYQNPALRESMGLRARRFVETRFSEPIFLDRISRVLERTAGRLPGGEEDR
jgi:glycosyltransferase involved in cell wall biosynthesis